MFMKAILSFVLSVIFVIITNAQNKIKMRADDLFNREQYSEALNYYKKSLTKVGKDKNEKAALQFQIAECYKFMNDLKQAETWYGKCLKGNYSNPLAVLYYANILKGSEKYKEAIEVYRKFKELMPGDVRGANGEESCLFAQKWMENPTRYQIENMRKLNGKSRDFSPSYADSKYRTLVFTSAREGSKGKGTDAWTGEEFSDLYFAKKDNKNSWKTPIPFADILNTPANEGASCINESGTTIYFTRCKVEKKGKFGCQIFKANKTGKDWGDAEVIKISEDTLLAIGHPAVNKAETELYFAAELPNGIGGKDIWVIKRETKSGTFGKPENLGETINTPGNEVFPYVAADGTLFFASDGHVGLGGLDIFKSEYVDGQWSKAENMKYPMNTSYDDFGIVFENNMNRGFLSSNRKGSRGKDDIWSFYLPPLLFTLQGTVYDDSTGKPVANAKVTLVGSNGSSLAVQTDSKGFYLFNKTQIAANTTYDITINRQGYFTGRGKETTVGLEKNTDLTHDFKIAPIPKKPIVLPDILYDLAKWDLKPQYQDSLDGLIQTLQDNPHIVIELASHTDSRASDAYNDTLSQKRAQSVVDYLIQNNIETDRLIAKGYGERIPRALNKDFVFPGIFFKQGTFIKNDTVIGGVELKKGLVYQDIKTDTIVFYKGTVLDEVFINALVTQREKELAHQLNRRTEFSVIRSDYVPKNSNINIVNPTNNSNGNKNSKIEKPK